MAKNNEAKNNKGVKRSIPGLLIYLFQEILNKKKWFLLPLWILLVAIALILLISGTSSYILPAIYIGF